MPTRSLAPLHSIILVVPLTFLIAATASAQVTWNIDNTTNIGGNAVSTVVGSPTIVATPFGNALRFDGNDGIILNTNPVAGAAQFTIEMLFRPDPIVNAANFEPRVLFIQSLPNPPDHRAALETRIPTSSSSNWYIDTFLRSKTPGAIDPNAATSLTLIEDTKLHPLGQWYNYAMTYDGSQLKAWVNGQLDSAGNLAVQAMAPGRISIGMRITQEKFFEGVVAKVRFTNSVVDPASFMSAVIPGDYDRNGTVNAVDYDAWRSTFGNTVAAPGGGADGNGNGIVDAADYVFWRDRAPAGSAAAVIQSVPEPATAFVLAAGIIGLSRRRQMRSR